MELKAFPGETIPEDLKISCHALWTGSRLNLHFQLTGPFSTLQGVQGEGPLRGGRKDDLWKTTCFEAFFQGEGTKSYWELNLSPSGDWAIYRFGSYRNDRTNPSLSSSPVVSCEKKEKAWHLHASLDLGDQDELNGRPLTFSPCSVVQLHSGEMSYWAVEHRGEKPDFHHPSRFVRLLLPQVNS